MAQVQNQLWVIVASIAVRLDADRVVTSIAEPLAALVAIFARVEPLFGSLPVANGVFASLVEVSPVLKAHFLGGPVPDTPLDCRVGRSGRLEKRLAC